MTLPVGATSDINMSPCAEVPTLSATPEASVRALGGTLFTLSASLLCGHRGTGIMPVSLPPPASTLCRPTNAGLVHGPPAIVGSQQTLDSAQRVQLQGSQPDSAQNLCSGAVDSAPTQTRAEESARTGEPLGPSVGEIGGSNSPAPQAYPTDAKVRE